MDQEAVIEQLKAENKQLKEKYDELATKYQHLKESSQQQVYSCYSAEISVLHRDLVEFDHSWKRISPRTTWKVHCWKWDAQTNEFQDRERLFPFRTGRRACNIIWQSSIFITITEIWIIDGIQVELIVLHTHSWWRRLYCCLRCKQNCFCLCIQEQPFRIPLFKAIPISLFMSTAQQWQARVDLRIHGWNIEDILFTTADELIFLCIVFSWFFIDSRWLKI